jgi:hypothetical protein
MEALAVKLVDAQLARLPHELPMLRRGLDDEGMLWRVAATVVVDGHVRQVCLGFAYPRDEVSRIGITDTTNTVVPLGTIVKSKVELLERPGLSIMFLLSYVRFLEDKLLRMHAVCVEHRLEKPCLYEDTYHRVFQGSSPDMPGGMVLSLCAATVASEAFFTLQAYGGPNNMPDLFGAAEEVFLALDRMQVPVYPGGKELVEDLGRLWQLEQPWSAEDYDMQRNACTFVLALMRTVECFDSSRALEA